MAPQGGSESEPGVGRGACGAPDSTEGGCGTGAGQGGGAGRCGPRASGSLGVVPALRGGFGPSAEETTSLHTLRQDRVPGTWASLWLAGGLGGPCVKEDPSWTLGQHCATERPCPRPEALAAPGYVTNASACRLIFKNGSFCQREKLSLPTDHNKVVLELYWR